MSNNTPLIQKLSGLGAVVLLTVLLLGPLLSATGKIAESEQLLSEKRTLTALLEDRITSDKGALRKGEPTYARLQRSLLSEDVAVTTLEACEEAAARFAAFSIQQSCAASQSQTGGGLVQHTTQLITSGPWKNLLQAIDSLDAESSLDIMRITIDPDAPATATLTLRFSDVGKTPLETEPQP